MRWAEGLVTLDEGEQSTIANALRVAAEQYDRDAQVCAETPGQTRVAEQFRRQAEEARKMAAELDEGPNDDEVSAAKPERCSFCERAAFTLKRISADGVDDRQAWVCDHCEATYLVTW